MTLDTTINPGQGGHIADHDEIATLINEIEAVATTAGSIPVALAGGLIGGIAPGSAGQVLTADPTFPGKAKWAPVVLTGGEFDVRAFAAGVGNGDATIDTPALQAAVTAAQAEQGTVILPVGRLRLNDTILAYNPVGIRGRQRYGTKVLITAGFPVDAPVFLFQRDMSLSVINEELHVPGCTLEDFTVYGNARLNRANAFRFEYFDRIKANRVQCRWFRGTCWDLAMSVRESHFDSCDCWGSGDTANDRPVLDMRDRGTANAHNLNRWTNFTFGLNCGDGIVIGTGATAPGRVNGNFFSGTVHQQTEWITTGNDNEYGIDGVSTEVPSCVQGIPIRIINAQNNFFHHMRLHLPGRGLGVFSFEPGPGPISTLNDAVISGSLIGVFPRGTSGYSPISVTADASGDTLTVPTPIARHLMGTGAKLRISAASMPGGLAAATDYYAIRVSGTVFKVATTRANAVAGTAIDITSAGSGAAVTQYDYAVAVDATADTLTSQDNTLRTTARVRVFSDGGTLPGGLTAATDYYWIEQTAHAGKLALNKANARAGSAIDITSAGTGVIYLETQEFPIDTETGSNATIVLGQNRHDSVSCKRAFVRIQSGSLLFYDPLTFSGGGNAVEYSSGAAHVYSFPSTLNVTAGSLTVANNVPIGSYLAGGTFAQLARISSGDIVALGDVLGVGTTAQFYAKTTLQLLINAVEKMRLTATGVGFFDKSTAPVRPTLPAAGAVTAADIRTALIDLGLCQ